MKKAFLAICIFLVVAIPFSLLSYAVSFADTLTTSAMFNDGDELAHYFYNTDYADQESGIPLSFYQRQNCHIKQYYNIIFSFNDIESRDKFIEYIKTHSDTFQFLRFYGNVNIYVESYGDSVGLTAYNANGEGKSYGDSTGYYVETSLTLEWDQALSLVNEVRSISNGYYTVPIPYSGWFYLQPVLPSDFGINELIDYYVVPRGTTITPGSAFLSANPGINIDVWYADSFQTVIDKSDAATDRSLRCTFSGGENSEAYTITKDSDTSLFYPDSFMTFEAKSNLYNVAFKGIKYSASYKGYFHFAFIPGSNVVYQSETTFNELPVGMSFMYAVRDTQSVPVLVPPSSDTSKIDVSSLYVEPSAWYDIPAYLNNFAIWFCVEAPLVSTIFKPIVLIAKNTADIYAKVAAPFLTATGIFGTAAIFFMLYKLLTKIIGARRDD